MKENKRTVKLKICGLSRYQDMEAINVWSPDYIGFVFAKSRRQVTGEQAKELKKVLNPNITAVGVFAEQDPSMIIGLLLDGTIDIAQLHGQESEETVRRIQKEAGKPVIKAISVKGSTNVQAFAESSAEYLLFDNGTGGTGEQFDWNLLKEIDKPWFLAGGIGLHNIREALGRYPWAVDLSSGVETDGRKDAVKIEQIVKTVRKFNGQEG
ncbi:MAG: phosphoribosylanthranilate isomerase [Lachnospiraceae bacterium]